MLNGGRFFAREINKEMEALSLVRRTRLRVKLGELTGKKSFLAITTLFDIRESIEKDPRIIREKGFFDLIQTCAYYFVALKNIAALHRLINIVLVRVKDKSSMSAKLITSLGENLSNIVSQLKIINMLTPYEKIENEALNQLNTFFMNAVNTIYTDEEAYKFYLKMKRRPVSFITLQHPNNHAFSYVLKCVDDLFRFHIEKNTENPEPSFGTLKLEYQIRRAEKVMCLSGKEIPNLCAEEIKSFMREAFSERAVKYAERISAYKSLNDISTYPCQTPLENFNGSAYLILLIIRMAQLEKMGLEVTSDYPTLAQQWKENELQGLEENMTIQHGGGLFFLLDLRRSNKIRNRRCFGYRSDYGYLGIFAATSPTPWRSNYYANTRAPECFDQPAVLTGKIQTKHLAETNNFIDETVIPGDKIGEIEDPKIEFPSPGK